MESLCISLVVLLSSGQYRLECDLQKFEAISIIHGEPAFERTEPNMFIATHIALGPKPGLAKSEHASVMTEATPMHSFWRFSLECSTSFQVWQVPIELGREKTHVHAPCNFDLILLRLGQNGLPPPRHQNLSVQQ